MTRNHTYRPGQTVTVLIEGKPTVVTVDKFTGHKWIHATIDGQQRRFHPSEVVATGSLIGYMNIETGAITPADVKGQA